MTTRDNLRAKLLSSQVQKPERRTIEFFGEQIDLVQPPLHVIMKPTDPDKVKRPIDNTVDMLLDYACVPGTDERIYEEGDRAFLRSLPWGPDMVRVNRTIQELTGLGDLEQAKQELKDPLSSPPTESPNA